MVDRKKIKKMPAFNFIAAVSVGVYRGQPVLDLDYAEDVLAETDMNIIMNEQQQYIEVQGTAEEAPFSHHEFIQLLELAQQGIPQLIEKQKQSYVS